MYTTKGLDTDQDADNEIQRLYGSDLIFVHHGPGMPDT